MEEKFKKFLSELEKKNNKEIEDKKKLIEDHEKTLSLLKSEVDNLEKTIYAIVILMNRL